MGVGGFGCVWVELTEVDTLKIFVCHVARRSINVCVGQERILAVCLQIRSGVDGWLGAWAGWAHNWQEVGWLSDWWDGECALVGGGRAVGMRGGGKPPTQEERHPVVGLACPPARLRLHPQICSNGCRT